MNYWNVYQWLIAVNLSRTFLSRRINYQILFATPKINKKFFLSQKSGNAIGVDRTFNLAHFYVTALVGRI